MKREVWTMWSDWLIKSVTGPRSGNNNSSNPIINPVKKILYLKKTVLTDRHLTSWILERRQD